MIKFVKIAKVLFVLVSVLFVTNCSHDEIGREEPILDAKVIEAKNWFDDSNPELTILKHIKEINWNAAIITDGVKGTVIEIPIVLKDNVVVTSESQPLKTYNRLMFTPNEKEGYKLSHIVIAAENDKFDVNDKNFNFYKVKTGFEGFVTTLGSQSKINYFSSAKKRSATSITGKINMEDAICIGIFEMYSDGSSRFVSMLFCDDQGGNGPWDGGGGAPGGGDDYGGNSNGQPTRTAAQIVINRIDVSNLDDCPKEIFEELKKKSHGDFANMLTSLGTESEYTVEMKMGKLTNASNYAETNRNGRNDYTITISQNYENATKLYKATAIAHELVHAYFLSVVDNYNTYPNNDPFRDYPTLFEFYVANHPHDPNMTVPAQHEAMAVSTVNTIASAIYGYQLNNPPYVLDIDLQVYKDLVWGGLMETPTFKAKFPVGSNDYNRILNRVRAEQSGRPSGEGTPNAQSPRGIPCK